MKLIHVQAVLLGTILIAFFLLTTSPTSADIFDEVSIRPNKLESTTLAFSERHSATNERISFLFTISGFIPSGFDVKGIKLKKDGKMNFKYRISAVKQSGDDDFCTALKIKLISPWETAFEGPLLALSTDRTINSTGVDNWIIYLERPSNTENLKNKTCNFDIIMKSWRVLPDEQTGFWDREILHSTVSSAS